MSGRQGSLMRFQADCGHWMVVYSLEPTPEQCPDCADKGRDALASALKYWERDLSSAVSRAEDCGVGDADEWVRENALAVTDDIIQKLQFIGDRCANAAGDLDQAHRELRDILAKIPAKAERLTLPAVAS